MTRSYTISQFLNARIATTPKFTPDGEHLIFISDITGLPQLYRTRIADTATWPDQITFEDDRVMWFDVMPDSSVWFARDIGGNENMQYFILDSDGVTITALTAGHEAAMHIPGVKSHDGSQIVFSANRRDPGLFDLYQQKIGAEATLVWENTTSGSLVPMDISPDGSRVLAILVSGPSSSATYQANLKSGIVDQLTPIDEKADYISAKYNKTGNKAYLLTNANSEFMHILEVDPYTGEQMVLLATNWDIEEITLSSDGGKLAYTVNEHGATHLHIYDFADGKSRKLDVCSQPAGVISTIKFSPDGNSIAYTKTAANHTENIFLVDVGGTQVKQITRSSQGGIPSESMSVPELIHYPTFDKDTNGATRQIPAWFYRPQNTDGGKIPVIVYVHGGPASQFRPNYFAWMQYFVRNGYAILAPNVRGSSGYGKTYMALDDVALRMDSVADLAHAAHWIKAQPELDGDHIIVYGRSYGGFMVLSAMTTYPDLWVAGVEFVGISNWVTFLENTSDYRRKHREGEYGSLEHDREFLHSISPINHVEKIKAPLLVFHGRNDPRVPVGETTQMVEAIRTQGVPVEYIIFEDEGHGMVKLHNKLVAYDAIMQFLANLRQDG